MRWIAVIVVVLAVLAGGWYMLSNKGAVEGKDYKVGILVRGSGYEPAVAGFKQRMDQLGYHEGANITYDVQYISDQTQLTATVDKFLAEGVNLIHTYSTPATVAAINETEKKAVNGQPVPVVFGSVGDPLLLPNVKSINAPGGNATGVASLSTDLTNKRLELLNELDPKIKRVAMPATDPSENDLAANKSVQIAQAAAKDFGMTLTVLPVKTAADNASVAAEVTHKLYDGMIVGGDSLVWGGMSSYVAQAIAEKIPFSVFSSSQVQQGALMGLGPDFSVSGSQSADIANKILRGGDPAQIPVQIPQKLILVINMDTARKMGLTVNDALLKKADVVIDSQKQQ